MWAMKDQFLRALERYFAPVEFQCRLEAQEYSFSCLRSGIASKMV